MAGWTKAWRKEVRSSIWDMPPLYHRVFLWLRYKVEHKTTLFPTRRKFGIWTNPGQILTSVRNIAEGVSWVEDGKDKTPNVKTIKGILGWLEAEGAIKLLSNTFGTYISLENWDTYQAQDSQEVTAKGQPKGQPNGHTLRRGKKVKEKDLKNLKGGKSEKEAFCFPEWMPQNAWESYEAMRKKIRKPMTPEAVVLAVGKLDRLRQQGDDPREVLEQSVFNSWQGLFAIKDSGATRQGPKGKMDEVEDRLDAWAGGHNVEQGVGKADDGGDDNGPRTIELEKLATGQFGR